MATAPALLTNQSWKSAKALLQVLVVPLAGVVIIGGSSSRVMYSAMQVVVLPAASVATNSTTCVFVLPQPLIVLITDDVIVTAPGQLSVAVAAKSAGKSDPQSPNIELLPATVSIVVIVVA